VHSMVTDLYLAISPVVPVWLVGIYPVLVRW